MEIDEANDQGRGRLCAAGCSQDYVLVHVTFRMMKSHQEAEMIPRSQERGIQEMEGFRYRYVVVSHP